MCSSNCGFWQIRPKINVTHPCLQNYIITKYAVDMEWDIQPVCVVCWACLQIWVLEKNGGSLVGGALKLMQERRKNPPPPRDPRLPSPPKV